MFMYGSILIAVTLSPVVLSSVPVDEALHVQVKSILFRGLKDIGAFEERWK
jgi:hypothetical protein